MIKRQLMLFSFTLLLLTTAIETRRKPNKCPPIVPSGETPPSCWDGVVKVGSSDFEKYINCKDCFYGSDVFDSDPTKLLSYRLNTVKVFGTDGWTWGATVSPTTTSVGNNVINLKYNSVTKSWYFDSNTTKKYEIVISLQTEHCYTIYQFNCLSFTEIRNLIYNTLGIDKGTLNQTVKHVTYFYKECGSTGPVDCNKGTITVDGAIYIDCENCISGDAYSNTDPSKLLIQKLNTELIFSTGGWISGGGINVSSGIAFGSNTLLLTKNPDGSFAFKLNSNIKYEVVVALQGVNCYTTYLFDCLTFDGTNALLFNTLGHDLGTAGQTITQIDYFYRECGYTIVSCTSGTVSVDGANYIDCENCIPGDATGNIDSTKNLDYQLNTLKIFGTDGWTFGAKVSQTTSTPGNNVLGLTYTTLNGYAFTKTTSTQYQVVIAVKAGSCYVPYLFPCMPFDKLKNIIANTYGVDKGTGQPIDYIVYFFKECPSSPCVINPTEPKLPGEIDCVLFGTVYSTMVGKYEACWGSYVGSYDDGKCTFDENNQVCLYRVLNTPTKICGIDWCFIEKIDIGGSGVNAGFNWTITVTSGTDGRKGTYTLQNWITTPYIITLKAATNYSAYFVQSGMSGVWETFNNGLSHASLWTRCPPAPAFLQLDSK